MRKHIIICALLLLTLCGCGSKGLTLPEITHTDKEAYYPSYFSDEPVQAQNSYKTATKTELNVMDEGFHADTAAAIGNTILVADLDSRNYQAVLFRLETDENNNPTVTEQKILLRSDTFNPEYTKYLFSITAGQDGRFYILSGEAPRISMKKAENGDYICAENPDYCGRYRITSFDADGNMLSYTDIAEFPSDNVCNLWAGSGGRIYITGAKSIEDEGSAYLDDFVLYEFSMDTGIGRSMDFKTGDVPNDMQFTEGRNYIAVSNGERVKLHEFDTQNFTLGAAVPSIAYRDFFGRSSSCRGEIILPSTLDFCVYNVEENTLTPVLSRSDSDTGWYDNCTVILLDERTVICAARGSEFLSVYRLP